MGRSAGKYLCTSVRMYVIACMHVSAVYLSAYVRMRVCVSVRTTYVCIYMHIHIYPIYAWMHGCLDKWMDKWMDGWMDGWAYVLARKHAHLHVHVYVCLWMLKVCVNVPMFEAHRLQSYASAVSATKPSSIFPAVRLSSFHTGP